MESSGGKDVFLSHSGKQKNFVRQLHRDLTREHVSCFFDEDRNSLPLAERFPTLIFKAAETCKLAVLVISREFICSKWPMLELSAFIRARNSGKNSNLKLLPIFFKISPKELHITKDNAEWQKMEVSSETRGEWQDALKLVHPLNGLTFGKGGDQVAFRDEVIKEIGFLLKGINRRPQPLDFQPVGIEDQVQEVKSLLNMEGAQAALAVILYGFGGVGKSTLAASVVESLDWSSMDYRFCRVAIDEKTCDRTSHIINLQKRILHVLERAEVDVGDTLEGRGRIKEALKNKCSLLFIDNVVDKDYVRDLLPKDLPWEDQGTKLRIIITSREKNVNAEIKIMCKEYEVKCLSDAASKTLLSKTILENQVEKIVPDQVVENIYLFEEEELMINEVAAACRGVPLLLSVFGKHLSVERDKENYQEALDALREGDLNSYRDEDLDTRLMFVFNKIKDEEVKDAFLDICMYFNGWEWDLVRDIIDSPHLKDLHRRALVSKSSSGEVMVHDILRFMGMKTAKLNRFSNYKELRDALKDNLVGSENVKGISLLHDNDNGLTTIKPTQLEAMHQSLRVLMVGDRVTLDGPPCHTAFENLRYLSVGDIPTFPLEDLSKSANLRVFENSSQAGMNLCHLPSNLKRISHQVPHVECDKFVELPLQHMSSLKSFSIKSKTQKSVELPEELHLPASLEHLELNTCKNLPKDIGNLIAVESLNLDRSDLEYLPQGFGQLKKLKHVSMNYCSKLVSLSEELGMLSSLEALSMNCCPNLRALPKSLGRLLSLRTLEFSKCVNLQKLPESFGELRIESLNLHLLIGLNELPHSLGNMPLLKDLSLVSCHSLMSLPKSFVQLKMLVTLKIIDCIKLNVLPEDFGRLICLKHMIVNECHVLKELPHGFGALPALKTLTLTKCKSFVNLSRDFGKLKKIRFLDVGSCFQLKTLCDNFENMATLEQLSIRNCSQLDGAMMEKILKLANCYMAKIYGSRKLLEKWKHMQGEAEHPFIVYGVSQRDIEDEWRAIRVSLLHGKCMEVNNSTYQLMERSSLLVGLEEGIRTTVALIMLPIHVEWHHHQTLQQIVEMAWERAETNRSGKLQIVCARNAYLFAKRATPTEEEKRADEEVIRQILLWLPKGSCAIPFSECKRIKILTKCCEQYLYRFGEFSLFMTTKV